MADDADSKSVGGNTVWVQVPPPAPARRKRHIACDDFFTKNHRALILLLLASPRNFASQIFVGSLAALSGGKRASCVSLAATFFKSHRRAHFAAAPSPRETLLRKLSWGPRPPCRAANVQAVYRLRRLFCKSHRRAHSAAPRFPALPGGSTLRSIQKARPPGRAFFVVLLSKQHALGRPRLPR